MAMKASLVQSRCVCFSEKCFRSAITFEAEGGYMTSLGRNTRVKNVVFSNISRLFSRSKHKLAKNLLEEVDAFDVSGVAKQSKLLKKVSVLVGCDGLGDVFDEERAKRELYVSLKGEIDVFSISLACKQFPSITLGSSPPVELFDETTSSSDNGELLVAGICKSFLPSSIGAKWVSPDYLDQTWQSLKSDAKSCSRLEKSLNGSAMTESTHDADKPFSGTGIKNQPIAPQLELILDQSISSIPGLSRRHCRQLENCGFHTLRKLLHHFPRAYADLKNPQVGIDDGQYLIFVGKVLSSRGIRASYSFSYLEVIVTCEVADDKPVSDAELNVDDKEGKTEMLGKKKTIFLHLKKYFRGTRFTYVPFLKSLEEKHKEGDVVCVSGKVRKMRAKDHYEIREYNIDILQDDEDSSVCSEERPYPIYPSKGGLKPSFLRDIISRVLKVLPINVDPIPEDLTEELGLLCLHNAYIGIHRPKNLNEADLARKRLIFDEFFYIQLARLFQMLEGLVSDVEKDSLLDKYRMPELNKVDMNDWTSLSKKFLKALPFSLTSSQLNAVSEIIWDLKRPVPMNRLLQGDVGCGKTVVAFLACMEVIGSGYQAAFMVPTELLAIQHYEQLQNLLENMEAVDLKPSVALLTGSTSSKQSNYIRKGLQDGDISLVIGTHSLIAEKVEFSALRITVVDEQHRFGVIQRGQFNSKLYYNSISSKLVSTLSDKSSGSPMVMAPHVLAMSATPIPRSLALALYGDMSLTQITDLPPGRIPVETYIIEGNETGFESVYEMMMDELEKGGKIYLVYPVIEQSEQLPQLRAASADLETISKRFPEYKCGLLHGKMKSDQKDEALRQFRSGETNILLSTQVIEIGVDVPDASMMVVMNSERFGIAQLHQLRGRVGRGERKSKCILVASTSSGLSRLKVLEKSSDGFHLANMDLLLRGPGDLLGKKQSGHLPEFPITRLEMDGNILQEAHFAALKILRDSHDLEKYPGLKAELSMRQPLCILGD